MADKEEWDERYQFRHMLVDKILHLSISKSLAIPMIRMTHIPLILLMLVWSLPAHAGFCDYEDVPNLLDTIERVPMPGMPNFMGLTEDELEATKKELDVRMKESKENQNYRNIVGMSFTIWAHVDCGRQLDPLRDKNEALEILHLSPPYESNDVDAVFVKVVEMTYAGSGVEEIQKMAQTAFRELLNRENRGESIHW